MNVIFEHEYRYWGGGETRAMKFTHDDVLYAIGVVMRGQYIQDDTLKYRKITCIKKLREERNCGLLEAKLLIEFAEEMLKKIEGLKLPAALNPLE